MLLQVPSDIPKSNKLMMTWCPLFGGSCRLQPGMPANMPSEAWRMRAIRSPQLSLSESRNNWKTRLLYLSSITPFQIRDHCQLRHLDLMLLMWFCSEDHAWSCVCTDSAAKQGRPHTITNKQTPSTFETVLVSQSKTGKTHLCVHEVSNCHHHALWA